MDVPLSDDAQAILDVARIDAGRRGAPSVLPEHVFLALLEHDDDLAVELIHGDVPVRRVITHLKSLLGGEEPEHKGRDPSLSVEAQDVLSQAAREAWIAGHNRVSPRDLLVALIWRPWDKAARILAECDVDVAAVRDRLRPRRRGRSAPPPPEPTLGPLAEWVDDEVHALIKRASTEAAAQDYRRVQPQHLLMALLQPEDGFAAQAFRAVEVDPLDLRDEASHWISSDAEGELVGGVRVSRAVVEVLRYALKLCGEEEAPKASLVDLFRALLRSGDPFLPTILERFHVPPREIEHELADLAGPDRGAILEEAASMSMEACRQATHDAELDRALVLAREAAERGAADHVGTEHLLLALVLDTHPVAARALQACGIDIMRARELIEPATWGRSTPRGELPRTPRADRALHVARLEACHLGHARVATGHLLLALYWQRKGTASRLLRELGVVPSRLRKEVLAATGDDGDAERRAYPPLTTRARVTMGRAARIAAGSGAPAVNRGHLLQALLPMQGGTARGVLESLGLDRGALAAKADEWAQTSKGTERPRAFTASAWEILGAAWGEAERQGLGHVGTSHLLCALLGCATEGVEALPRAVEVPTSKFRAILDRILRVSR